MENVINLTPEALELVNKMLNRDALQERIDVLDDAEEKLQDLAYQSQDSDEAMKQGFLLYDTAYTLKTYKKQFMKLKTLIYGNGTDED
jgi:hypothetical protein